MENEIRPGLTEDEVRRWLEPGVREDTIFDWEIVAYLFGEIDRLRARMVGITARCGQST